MENTPNIVCFECGKPADVQHHVVPQSKGGTKTVPLCWKCHSVVHSAKLTANSTLIKEGRERAKANNSWSKVTELFKIGLKKTEIAKIVGISRNAVYHILEKTGLHTNTGRGCETKVTPELLDNIKNARDSGKSWVEIQEQFDICQTHLYRLIKEHGWYDNKYHSGNKSRKEFRTLTPEKIEEAKRLREEKRTWAEIGDMIGVDRFALYWHGIPQQFKPLRGQFTADKKVTALELKRAGKTWKEIAAHLEVSVGTIYASGIHKQV